MYAGIMRKRRSPKLETSTLLKFEMPVVWDLHMYIELKRRTGAQDFRIVVELETHVVRYFFGQ